MRQLVYLLCCLGLGMPAAAHAQVLTQAPASSPSGSDTSNLQTPPEPAQQPAATAPAEGEPEVLPSLFEPTWNQFMFGGRWSSVSGDPARWQRYQDLRDGVLFRDARFAREDPDGNWLFRATADNVGYRDQQFSANYERTGRFVISGLWNEIPQFYSVDTKTPYTRSDSPLLLDDATQRAVQNGQATPPLSAYLPIASQFDLRERRDIGNVSLVATPTQQLDLTATFTTQRHVGELPWGASFGFSNDVEVALPYESVANDFTVGTEWTNGRNMLRVSYNGSWFDNQQDTLVWDSPLRLDDLTSAPGRGRMSLWPTNSAQTVSAAGYAKLARRTQFTGFVSYGVWSNDEPLQPFTINSALPQFELPRASADGEAHVFSTNLNLVSRPFDEWRFSARLRRYDYNNESPHTSIPQFINYDTSVKTSSTGGPEPFAHSRTTFDADATWSGLQPLAITVGYTRNNGGYDFRIFDDNGENVLHLTADAVGSQWVTFRADYELADRSGSGLNEDLLVEIGEQPAMRHYDVANRTRNKFTGQVDVTPNDLWIFSASAGLGKDEYDDSYFGLQESTFRVFSLSADYQAANGLGAGASYNYERYAGLQRSRSASPGQSPPQETDPLRDWTADSVERVNYFSIYAKPPRIGDNTEARLSYDYSYAEGKFLYGVVAGGPLPPPSQLPKVYNKLQQLHVDVRHRISKRLAATLSYLYEPFRVYDFAFDPSVVNSIVQPSSLVLGYVYRPYTAHSASFGIMYFW
jgi:MtrB/PioB family decaheme-associated outer membrane protein